MWSAFSVARDVVEVGCELGWSRTVVGRDMVAVHGGPTDRVRDRVLPGPAWNSASVSERAMACVSMACVCQACALPSTIAPFTPSADPLNAPRRTVIRSEELESRPEIHRGYRTGSPRRAPSLRDRSPSREGSPDRYSAVRSAGSDPSKTCGFLAQSVFLRHTHRAVAPGLILPVQEG